jgi:hypothetical protein
MGARSDRLAIVIDWLVDAHVANTSDYYHHHGRYIVIATADACRKIKHNSLSIKGRIQQIFLYFDTGLVEAPRHDTLHFRISRLHLINITHPDAN